MQLRPSPNRDARPPGAAIDCLVFHYTGMASAAAAIERLCDPAARVSAHYVVDEAGVVTGLVAEDYRAWHAGISMWEGRQGLNDVSIGIEVVNPGHEFGYRPFPPPQVVALIELAREILARHNIPPTRVVGHSDIAPDRKRDPGELFPWPRLASEGVGLWPREAPSVPPDQMTARSLLAQIGYPVGSDESGLGLALVAFQRRFRPLLVDGRLDIGTMGRLCAVARAYAASRGLCGQRCGHS